MYQTKTEWKKISKKMDEEAIESMLDIYNEEEKMSSETVLCAILDYNGHGMSVERLRELYERYLAENTKPPRPEICGRKDINMYTATINMSNNGELYTGATARGKTIERAIMLAHQRTSNTWGLTTWAEVDGPDMHGERINYVIMYDTSTGKDTCHITE